MVDPHYADPELAARYDALNGDRDDLDFYLPMVQAARAVLDVGCGTGLLLSRAREAGHTGRLCGLDPAEAMLAVARRRTDVEWVCGDLASTDVRGPFDLVVMTGHAFQTLVTDEEVRTALTAIRTALAPGGRFAFETRNPAARAWERWTPDTVMEVVDETGAVVRSWHQVDAPVEGELVRFTQTVTSSGWDLPRTSPSTLRFLGPHALDTFLAGAGLEVEERFGDWAGGPFTATSPEIVTVARRG